MTADRNTPALLLALLLAAGGLPAAAQEGGFSGEIRVGYRAVDVGGTETKYREDVNLDDGPRLFTLALDYVPAAAEGERLVDRMRLDVDSYGGDPFETLALGVRKFGVFDFRYDRRTSDYFYEDVVLPLALANPRISDGGDLHHFDFERVRDRARLDLEVSPRAKLHFGFDRYGKRGESTTTLDVSRDEFELDRPIDETLDEYFVGVEYAWNEVTLSLEERVTDYENVFELFLPGASQGENPPPGNQTALDFFFLDQPYDYRANDHVARVVATPGRWTIRGQLLVQSLDLDVAASERSQGTAFNGNPLATDLAGGGEIERDLDLFDLEASYPLSDRVAFVAGAYRRSLDQEGVFTFGGERNLGAWEIDTTGVEAGLEVAATATLTVGGGVRWEEREVRHDAIDDAAPGETLDLGSSETTDHEGYFAHLSWRPAGSGLTVNALVDSSSFDDPFTLTSPTDRLRWRLRLRWALGESGFSLAAATSAHDVDNDNSGWESSYDQSNLQLVYRRSRLDASLGYSWVEIERDVAQQVNGGAFFFPIAYRADADFIDGRVRFQAGERWVLGGTFRRYDNAGSFGIERDDYRAFVDYLFPTGYTLGLAYRTVDYDETAVDFDDYDADVLEASVGYRW